MPDIAAVFQFGSTKQPEISFKGKSEIFRFKFSGGGRLAFNVFSCILQPLTYS
jgi:hypothetical protein